MVHKIILADLEKCLFPELYPCYEAYFDKEKELLFGKLRLDKLSVQNISFKIKVTKYCCKIENKNVRYIFNHLLNKHIHNYYDWQKPYDWVDLKSVLFFFMVFSTVINEHGIKRVFDEKPIPTLFSKYLPIN